MPSKYLLAVCVALCLIHQHALPQNLETLIQKGHELAVLSVCVSPDKQFIVTGSRDKSAKLWDIASGREIRNFLGHEASVTIVKFTPDGLKLITGSNDKTIRIWNVMNGKEIHTLKTKLYIRSIAIDPAGKYLVFGGFGESGYQEFAEVVDLTSFKTLAKMPINPDQGLGSGVDIDISPDGKYLAIGEDNKVASLYKTVDWSLHHQWKEQEGFCGGCGTKVVFSPDNRSLFRVSHHGPLEQYDLGNFSRVKMLREEVEDPEDLAISDDGKHLALSTDEYVEVISIAQGRVAKAAKQEGMHQVAFASASPALFYTKDDNKAYQWNWESDMVEKEFSGLLNMKDKGGLNYDPNDYWESNIAKFVRFKNNLLLTPDGRSLIKGKFGTHVRQWNIASGKTEVEFSGHEKAVLCYDLSADGKKLVTGGGDGKIILWDAVKGDTLRTIQAYRHPVFDIHFSNDEQQVLSSSWDASVKIHDLASGDMTFYVDFENSSAYNLIYHPNNLYVIAGKLDNSLQMLEIDTRKVVRDFIGHSDVVSSIHVSADHTALLTSSWDGSIRIWDIGTGLMKKKFKDHQGAVHYALFNKNETIIFSAGADRVIRLWDVEKQTVTRRLVGHQAEITSLCLSPDERMLISHSIDGVTKCWDLTSGKEFFEHIYLNERDWMVKSPEGYFNGTDNARKFIHFVDGMKTYAVDQFFNDFYRPDLLPKIFQQRGAETMKTIQGKLKQSPLPDVKVAVVPGVTEGEVELYVRMIDNGGGIRECRVFHNGKRMEMGSGKWQTKKGEPVVVKQVVSLVGGVNIFSASAINNDNLESATHEAEYYYESGQPASTCYLIAVGINEYKNTRLSLNYAKPDAQAFADVLKGKTSKLFKHLELVPIYDKEATREKILAELDKAAQSVGPADVFIFYYAGHGSMVDNTFYFIPFEGSRLYDEQQLSKEAINANEVQEKLKKIKALKQMIIMDACQSGASVEMLATRGATEEKAIAQLSRSAGIHVMAAAGSEQFATEFADLGHGLFTYVMLRALQGEADGAPKDGKITIYELKSFIDDQVPEMTRQLKGKPQYPYTFSRGHDFPIAVEN